MRQRVRGVTAGVIAGACVLALAPTAGAAQPQANRVPVPDGRYGAVVGGARGPCLDPAAQPTDVCYSSEQLVSFTVRNRRIVNPRVAILVDCRYSDGTTSVVTFGPTSNDPSRTSPIPRSGNGTVSWVEDYDSSMVKDATVSLSFTFRKNGRHLVGVDVQSSDPEATCSGTTPFRLGDTSGIPASVLNR